MKNTFSRIALGLGILTMTGAALAGGMSGKLAVKGSDQDVSGGTVTTDMVMAESNGWLVVHRTDKAMKPGPVVAYAPLKKGQNHDVAAILLNLLSLVKC